MLPIPRKLLRRDVRDMLRISDARMSGTNLGACVLHVAPESYIAGPLVVVRTGDRITVNVAARRLDVDLSDDESVERLAAWAPPKRDYPRGSLKMHAAQHIDQADTGCGFDFRAGTQKLPEPEIH